MGDAVANGVCEICGQGRDRCAHRAIEIVNEAFQRVSRECDRLREELESANYLLGENALGARVVNDELAELRAEVERLRDAEIFMFLMIPPAIERVHGEMRLWVSAANPHYHYWCFEDVHGAIHDCGPKHRPPVFSAEVRKLVFAEMARTVRRG